MSKYWLLDWMDSEGVSSVEQGMRALESKQAVRSLLERGGTEQERALEPIPEAYEQLVAGTGSDLSGSFDCMQPGCIKLRVDQLVRRTWHLFDKVVVVGLDPVEVSDLEDELNSGAPSAYSAIPTVETFKAHLEVALYLRSIGAESHFVFTARPPYCPDHLDVHAKEVGIAPVSEGAKSLAKKLRGGVKVRNEGVVAGRQILSFTHPDLNTVQPVAYDLTEHINQRRAADQWIKNYSQTYGARLVSDAMIARTNSAALGRVALVEEKSTPKKVVRPSVADAAFNLSLPIIDSLPVKDLLAVRENEAADFLAFRSALRSAIKARIDSAPDADAASVAESVIDDILVPALVDLDRKVSRAGEALAKRSAAAVALGVTLTTVGLLAFAPLVAPGIIVGAGGLLTNLNDYLKDKKEVKLSDMHFLWHLSNRVDRHG